MLDQIGQYADDEESRYIEDAEDAEQTVKVTDEVESKYGIRVFETSALLGTGLKEVFDYVSYELLTQLISTDNSLSIKDGQGLPSSFIDLEGERSTSIKNKKKGKGK